MDYVFRFVRENLYFCLKMFIFDGEFKVVYRKNVVRYGENLRIKRGLVIFSGCDFGFRYGLF